MKQNQKNRRANTLFTLAALVVVLMSNVYVGRAEVITPKIKWEMSGNLYAISKPGRVLSTGTALVDLTNGKVLYRVKQDSGEVLIHLNYYGDRFYVQTGGPGNWYQKEFDTRTLEYLGIAVNRASTPTGLSMSYLAGNNGVRFIDRETKITVDSLNFMDGSMVMNYNHAFSSDGRYFIMNRFYNNNNNYLFLYDFTTKEMIIKGQLNTPYCFFNKSNKLALGEYIKLDGDNKPYAYVRIYDPDQRKYIKDINVGEHHFFDLTIKNEDDLLFYQIDDESNFKRLLDLSTGEIKDTEFLMPKVVYADDSLLIGCDGRLRSSEFDWKLVGIQDNKTVDDSIIYPNPTNNMLNISTTNEYYGGLWNITDINGKIYSKGIILPMPTLQIDISRLINGHYYLTLLKDKLIKTFKIVKQ